MRTTKSLLQYSARVTLFARPNCGLCDTAKATLREVAKSRPFDFHEINVMSGEQEEWRALYEFDTPVVRSRKYD